MRPLRKDPILAVTLESDDAILAVAVESQRRSQAVAKARTCAIRQLGLDWSGLPFAQHIAQDSHHQSNLDKLNLSPVLAVT